MNTIQSLASLSVWLQGKKTYIVAGVAAIVFFLAAVGVIPQEVANMIYTILGITGVVTVAAKINRKA